MKTKSIEINSAIGWRNNKNESSFGCAGSLISERFVLTVAHCQYHSTFNSRPSLVLLGTRSLARKTDKAVEIDIKIFIKHPLYDSKLNRHDIALIELVNNVTFSKFIRPACLNQKMFPSGFVVAVRNKRFSERFYSCDHRPF